MRGACREEREEVDGEWEVDEEVLEEGRQSEEGCGVLGEVGGEGCRDVGLDGDGGGAEVMQGRG